MSISKRNTAGYAAESIIKITGFSSDISDETFSVDGQTGMYAVLDIKNDKIIYGNVDEKEQKVIDISSEKINHDQSTFVLQISGDNLFFAVLLGHDHIEDHSEAGPKSH